MPNVKEVAHRITSVTATKQITQAMKMVAAAKLHKVQQQLVQMRPYAQKLAGILNNITASTTELFAQRYQAQRKVKHLLMVVMAADRGLCGASNTHILKKAHHHLQTLEDLPITQLHVLPIGQKALHFFEKQDYPLIPQYVTLSHQVDFVQASQAASWIIAAFLQHTYDRVVLVYNAFQSAATQVPTLVQFLPMIQETSQEASQPCPIDYIYEPSKAMLMQALVPQLLKIQFYQALLESHASEHGARMTTMSKATDNAEDLLKALRLTYNRTRQAAITREIAEIIAGAEALG